MQPLYKILVRKSGAIMAALASLVVAGQATLLVQLASMTASTHHCFGCRTQKRDLCGQT